jgi:hypothetical protein
MEVILFARNSVLTLVTIDIFGTGIALRVRFDVSQAVVGQCRLQLCAVLRSSGTKLPECIYIFGPIIPVCVQYN